MWYTRKKHLFDSNSNQYNDIRGQSGFKNVIIANRMSVQGDEAESCPFVKTSEMETFNKHKGPTYYWWVVLHELFGHGTGKMMVEESSGKYNFDNDNPPINPLTEQPITSWYKPGETWTGKFGDIATSVDECRAELVGACLLDDKELLEFFGFDENSAITADDSEFPANLRILSELIYARSKLQHLFTDRGRWSSFPGQLQC